MPFTIVLCAIRPCVDALAMPQVVGILPFVGAALLLCSIDMLAVTLFGALAMLAHKGTSILHRHIALSMGCACSKVASIYPAIRAPQCALAVRQVLNPSPDIHGSTGILVD